MGNAALHDDSNAGQHDFDLASQPVTSVLLLEAPVAPAKSISLEEPFRVLNVPDRPAALLGTCDDDAPTLVPIDAGDNEAVGRQAERQTNAPLFVTAFGKRGEQLIVVSEPGTGTRLNGLPAPLVAPLSPGDQVAFGPDLLLHVSRRIQMDPIPTPNSLVGQACEVCLLAFARESRVVICASCGAARHLESEEVPEEDRLQCALLGPCPNCGDERPESGGLAFVPEN